MCYPEGNQCDNYVIPTRYSDSEENPRPRPSTDSVRPVNTVGLCDQEEALQFTFAKCPQFLRGMNPVVDASRPARGQNGGRGKDS